MPDIVDAEVRSILLDDGKLHELVLRLTGQKRKTAKLTEVWSAFMSVYDDVPSGRERRLWLLTVLEELHASEEIELPVRHGKQWERTSDVSLPTKITLSSPEQVNEKPDWRTFAWHPELQWVFDRKHLTPSHFEFLRQVNQGLVEGWFGHAETLKYRSLQLTGDEKRLQKLCKCRLFGPGRLTLEQLGCEAEILPLAYERVTNEPSMLLFENAAPFILAKSVLKECGEPQVGCIAYGAGKQMVKSAGYLPLIEPSLERVLYVGDLDAEGVQLAADTKRLAYGVTVQPATAFHRAMINASVALGFADGWAVKENQPLHVADSVLRFLVSDDVRSKCAMLISTGRRIPEEVIPRNVMRRLLSGGFDNQIRFGN